MVAVRGGVHIIGQRLMKRRWLGIVFIFAVLVTGYQFVPSEPTDRDLAAVRRVVAKHTSQAILRIESAPSGAVQVTTGWSRGPLNGGGETFKLRKFFGIWWVYSKSEWAA